MFKKRLLPLLFSLLFISGCTPLLNPDIATQSISVEDDDELDELLAETEASKEESTEAATEATTEDSGAAASASSEPSQDSASAENSTASTASASQAAPAQDNAIPSTAKAGQATATPAPEQATATPTPATPSQATATPAPAATTQETPATTPVQRNLGNCGKAYEKAAKDFNANYNNYKYDLIYSDDDNTPELVIDTGKKVTVYTFASGKARCIVRNENNAKWKYGTTSFCYAPKKALFFENTNNWFGCFMEDRGVGDGSMLCTYSITNMNIYPKVSEVVPSEGSETSDPSKPAEYSGPNSSSQSAEQTQNKVMELINYDWQRVQGTMDYNTLLAKLEELGV
ncbi:MAG: hypothetical protein J5504_02755 [Butyrivibrio sp.]|nr:hypothetical protein [Butyrivibrio sp.]